MRLFLMRHAQTNPANRGKDLDRTLTDIGKGQAKHAAKFLHEYQLDKVLVSYAKRTMQTFNIIKNGINAVESEIVTELYHSTQEKILDLISKQEDRNSHILVIGHNPLIYDVALSLSDTSSKQYEVLIETSMPTARIIVIDFPEINSWENIKNNAGNIIDIFTPKSID